MRFNPDAQAKAILPLPVALAAVRWFCGIATSGYGLTSNPSDTVVAFTSFAMARTFDNPLPPARDSTWQAAKQF